MTVDPQAITALCDSLDEKFVREQVERFGDAYSQRFSPGEIAAHLRRLAKLSVDHCVETILTPLDDGAVSCTILAHNRPFLFSLITGVLAGTGFAIDAGDIFTSRPAERDAAAHPRRPPHEAQGRRASHARHGHANRSTTVDRRPAPRAIIDHFVGRLPDDVSFEEWSEQFDRVLREVIGRLARNDDKAVSEAKIKVNELVTRRIRRIDHPDNLSLLPVEIDIEQTESDTTCLRISAADTPAFLYALSTALALEGLSIERVRIGGDEQTVQDELFVVDRRGEPITGEREIEQLRFTVLLTKQFTYQLPHAPDPFKALSRFEQMAEDIFKLPEREQWEQMLSNPRAMEKLAKLLGASDYLWEDFIRVQYEALRPALKAAMQSGNIARPMETIPRRLEKALDGAVGLAEQRDRLNRFKDQELFRIDLDHILRPQASFRELSDQLTFLAETLVRKAAELVFDDLIKSYGQPRNRKGEDVHFAIFGLGKLGGKALGYASDIELLFVYGGYGRTTGGKRDATDNAEFFELFARETSQFIRTKQEGIFRVDLRLRPYGREAPLACTFDAIEKYYGPGGEAHPFERLALVRMRWIAGDYRLGAAVEWLRDRVVYEGDPIELDPIWEIGQKQFEQRNEPGRFNAKYSPGALVDLETTVMLMQVAHAREVPQLRTPRLTDALDALHRTGAIDANEFARLVGAYRFFRRLINALRMLRGSADDLFLPPPDDDEAVHLARRMGYEAGGDLPAEHLFREFHFHTANVRRFVRKTLERPCPGDPGADDDSDDA